MYLPRSSISQLYENLTKTHRPLSPPVLILAGIDPDALCACRILAALLRTDYISHKIQPIAGYGDLTQAGQQLIQRMRLADGGDGGVVVCVGVGGLVDLESTLGLEANEDGSGGFDGVTIWVFDSRRPWNLSNVFAGSVPVTDAADQTVAQKHGGLGKGQILRDYRPDRGGIVVFDDGDIEEELVTEKEAWFALEEMPDLDEDGYDTDASDVDSDEDAAGRNSKKRKSRMNEGDDSDDAVAEDRPPQRRRSNSVCLPSATYVSTLTKPSRLPYQRYL